MERIGFCYSPREVTKQQLHELWLEVRRELRTLTPLFDSSPEGATALEHFEEYISHNELALALETLCDFLVESEVSAISSEQRKWRTGT